MKQIRDTSEEVCELMFREVKNPASAYQTHVRILEPSCGEGKIVTYLMDNLSLHYGYDYTCIELNKTKLDKAREVLSEKVFYHSLTCEQADFLIWGKVERDPFDLIVACPPFKDNIDLEHIKLMYQNLSSDGGQLITLTSPFWITNNESHQVAFRTWLKDKDYHLKMLPDNSFKEKGKSVPTAILKISRYE